MAHVYKRLENGVVTLCPKNDFDGKYTGKVILNLPAYLDENPEERMASGWVKYIGVRDYPAYNPQTQYLQKRFIEIDEYTVQTTYEVMEKTEEMLLYEEMSMQFDTGGAEFDLNAAYQMEGNL